MRTVDIGFQVEVTRGREEETVGAEQSSWGNEWSGGVEPGRVGK